MRLLNASVLTAVSGSMRLYLAYLLAGLVPDFHACLAAGFTIYSTYTLDRALESKEDEINQSGFRNARRDIGLHVSFVVFLFGAVLFLSRKIFLAPFIPLIIGFFYSKGIQVRNMTFRLKGSLGCKNIVIGLTWGWTIALVIAPLVSNPLTILAVFLFFFTKLFINSAVYDMKDCDGDALAGIQTLPVVLGEHKTKLVLATMCVCIHLCVAFCMMMGIFQPEIIILATSFILSSCILLVYSRAFEHSMVWIERHFRILFIDCEAPAILLIRFIISG